MRRIYLTVFSLIIAASTAMAQEPKPLSMEQCVEYALKNNYAVKNARVDELIAQAQVNQTVSAALPHVNGKVDFTYFNVPQRQFIAANAFDPTAPKDVILPVAFVLDYAGAAQITTSQILFDGAVFVALQAKNSVVELARNTTAVTEETVRYNVRKAYYALVISYKQFDIIKNSLGYARAMEHDLEVMRRNGVAEKIDVDRSSVQVNNLATDSMRVSNLLTVSEQVLKYVMGMDINMPIVLTDTDTENALAEVGQLLSTQEDYERVPEFALANTALTLNQYNLRRYKFGFIPTLSAFWAQGSNYGSNKLDDIFKINRYWANSTIGVSLNVPLFNGLLRINQVKEAGYNIEKSKNNIDNLKLTIDFQTAQGRTNLRNSVLEVETQRRNMELSNSILELAQKKYKAGVGSNLEVTSAQTDLLRVQNNYFAALLGVVNAESDLRKALGLLK